MIQIQCKQILTGQSMQLKAQDTDCVLAKTQHSYYYVSQMLEKRIIMLAKTQETIYMLAKHKIQNIAIC